MQDEPIQTTPKAEIYQKNIMLSVCDYKGILHFELLPRNQTIIKRVSRLLNNNIFPNIQ